MTKNERIYYLKKAFSLMQDETRGGAKYKIQITETYINFFGAQVVNINTVSATDIFEYLFCWIMEPSTQLKTTFETSTTKHGELITSVTNIRKSDKAFYNSYKFEFIEE